MKTLWCVEFWDHGQWDEWAGTRMYHKAAVIAVAERMNRETSDEDRKSIYDGHRFRVRKAKD